MQVVRRAEPRGLPRWQRRWRWASKWLQGQWPWRTIWFWEPEVQHVLDRLLAQQSFDLVSVEDNAMGVYRYGSHAPLVFTEHEVRRPRSTNWRVGSPSNWLRWAWREIDWSRWRKYQLSIWRRFDLIQVFTRRDADAIASLAPDLQARVRVNPFGIEVPAPPDDTLEEKGRVLFVGNFTHAPNVDAALWLGREIMPRLRARCPEAHLALVGIYPPESVRALACEHILVTGPVPQIEPYFERASVVVAPLRIGGGMRMKVLQAMALGKAVVTTARGADGLMVDGQQPPLAMAETAEQIAATTAGLLADHPARRALGNRARRFVTEHYSARAYARRIEAVYADLQSKLRTSDRL